MQISPQGLVRLTYQALCTLPLTHLVSGADTDGNDYACGRITEFTGFTEWVTQSVPAITIGWDWKIQFRSGESQYERIGLPRSNVMFINDFGEDYGWDRNLEHLSQFADEVPWAFAVNNAIKPVVHSERKPASARR